MDIGIIGQGFVGNAIFQKFKKYFDIKTFDLDKNKCNSSRKEAMSCEAVFVCLPTPMNSDGSCNVDLVENTISTISSLGNAKIVIIKSTVTPGTTDRLNAIFNDIEIIFNPEFLTEANAVEDFNNQTRVILGGPRKATTRIKQVYAKVFPKASIIKTNSTYAEMVKYVTNSFLATKVSFANEMYEICKKLYIDYDKVIEYACYDERLGKSHWSVPGPDGDFGYGGHCFPKDVKALIKVAEINKLHPIMLIAANTKNEQIRQNKDWLEMKGRAVV